MRGTPPHGLAWRREYFSWAKHVMAGQLRVPLALEDAFDENEGTPKRVMLAIRCVASEGDVLFLDITAVKEANVFASILGSIF